MKTALIFPGQGSQFVGMGYDFYSNYQLAKDLYNKLDEIMGQNLSDLIFHGDESKLSLTTNSQPAIMTTSIAILEVLIAEKKISRDSYHCVGGHSLGEYSALVANKCITFEDSVKMLQARSKAMQECVPLGEGGMLALIGLANIKLDEIINKTKAHGKIFIANDNIEGQVVLSGNKSAIDYLTANQKELGIKKAIKLPVSAPFHCELMENASKKMEIELENYSFNNFTVPLFSNVTSNICDHTNIQELLVEQIVQKVRWREIMENMINFGIERFIEIGPGNVLTNLTKRASKTATVISISKVEDLKKIDNIIT